MKPICVRLMDTEDRTGPRLSPSRLEAQTRPTTRRGIDKEARGKGVHVPIIGSTVAARQAAESKRCKSASHVEALYGAQPGAPVDFPLRGFLQGAQKKPSWQFPRAVPT